MDPQLIEYYNRELHFIREIATEFAQEFPKIAGRLEVKEFECRDPYVERLLEGFAFLAARVQLKLDEQFPRLMEHMLEILYPHYLSPTPSMIVAQFVPDMAMGVTQGYVIPRHSELQSAELHAVDNPYSGMRCEYRTAHDVTLWPLQVDEAEYEQQFQSDVSLTSPKGALAQSAIRVRLRTASGYSFNDLDGLDRLTFYLDGPPEIGTSVLEELLVRCVGVLITGDSVDPSWHEQIPASEISRVGFGDTESLLPYTAGSFQGYRLLQEYFAFPERLRFVQVAGLRAPLARCVGDVIDLIFVLQGKNNLLNDRLSSNNFALFSTPASNVFPRTATAEVSNKAPEYRVLVDRERPSAYEIHTVSDVRGYGKKDTYPFLPFYRKANVSDGQHEAYFALRRIPVQTKREATSRYVPTDVFVSLVDPNEAPFPSDLRHLELNVLCTNGEWPMQIGGHGGFRCGASGPVSKIECLAGPTAPKSSLVTGDTSLRFVSHLSMNIMRLLGRSEKDGTEALRDVLSLYSHPQDGPSRQISGLTSVSRRQIVRQIPNVPNCHVPGFELNINCNEHFLGGGEAFLLCSVLSEFFTQYVSINSFVETVMSTSLRGEVFRWKAKIGTRSVL